MFEDVELTESFQLLDRKFWTLPRFPHVSKRIISYFVFVAYRCLCVFFSLLNLSLPLKLSRFARNATRKLSELGYQIFNYPPHSTAATHKEDILEVILKSSIQGCPAFTLISQFMVCLKLRDFFCHSDCWLSQF